VILNAILSFVLLLAPVAQHPPHDRFLEACADVGVPDPDDCLEGIAWVNALIDRAVTQGFIVQQARAGDREAILRLSEQHGIPRWFAEPVIRRESGFVPGARNRRNWPPSCPTTFASGVFQVLDGPCGWDDLYSPLCRVGGEPAWWLADCNIAVAGKLYDGGRGRSHWGM